MGQLLLIWAACGTVTGAVMVAGFHTKFGVLTPRLWAHVVRTVITWPIDLVSASVAPRHPRLSRVLEHLTGCGVIDAFFDWRDLRALRRFGAGGGTVAYLTHGDLRGVDPQGNAVDLASYENIVMDPETYVQCGGELPPERPEGDVLIRVSSGVAVWEVSPRE